MIPAAVERCAGIDVGKRFLAVCVMAGPLTGDPRAERRRYGVTVAELERLRAWLKQEGVTDVVMESTGSYWKPVFNVLEDAVRVQLANPEQVKNRKGHKTDDKDGWWLAHLLRHAMIHPSFIPPRPIRELRDLTRRRKKMLGTGTQEKNRVQKVLEDANVKLGNVLSDVFGVSGQLMLEALLEGHTQPEQIARHAQRRARKKIPQIVEALQGHQMNDHHRKMIGYSLEHMRWIEQQIEELDRAIEEKIRQAGLQTAWENLQSLPGIKQSGAASILAETGNDMQQFGSDKHLSSWTGVCPGNHRSGGKNKSSHSTGGNPWLRSALTECAWAAASKKDCFLKDKFWRIKAKSGGRTAPAVVAVAHVLVKLVYQVLSTGQPYQDKHLPPLDPIQKERLIRHHVRRLGKLGVRVRSAASAPTPGPATN